MNTLTEKHIKHIKELTFDDYIPDSKFNEVLREYILYVSTRIIECKDTNITVEMLADFSVDFERDAVIVMLYKNNKHLSYKVNDEILPVMRQYGCNL